MVNDAVAVEAVAARVGDKALYGLGLLLGGPAELVAGGEPDPTCPRDCHREAGVGGIGHLAVGVGPQRVGDLAVSGLVLPGNQPPGANQRVVCLHLVHGGLPVESAQMLTVTRWNIWCRPHSGRRGLAAEGAASHDLIIRLIIQTIRRDPSGAVWTDG